MLSSAVQPGRWGDYAPAIARWEQVMGCRAPEPTEPGKNGPRLSARFAEWLIGMDAGHVTDLVSRAEALRLIGNSVVALQGAAAVRDLAPTP
jgi:DNA (cytosine-5)-methyltransferase 1